jgi:hypothetical protein
MREEDEEGLEALVDDEEEPGDTSPPPRFSCYGAFSILYYFYLLL